MQHPSPHYWQSGADAYRGSAFCHGVPTNRTSTPTLCDCLLHHRPRGQLLPESQSHGRTISLYKGSHTKGHAQASTLTIRHRARRYECATFHYPDGVLNMQAPYNVFQMALRLLWYEAYTWSIPQDERSIMATLAYARTLQAQWLFSTASLGSAPAHGVMRPSLGRPLEMSSKLPERRGASRLRHP